MCTCYFCCATMQAKITHSSWAITSGSSLGIILPGYVLLFLKSHSNDCNRLNLGRPKQTMDTTLRSQCLEHAHAKERPPWLSFVQD